MLLRIVVTGVLHALVLSLGVAIPCWVLLPATEVANSFLSILLVAIPSAAMLEVLYSGLGLWSSLPLEKELLDKWGVRTMYPREAGFECVATMSASIQAIRPSIARSIGTNQLRSESGGDRVVWHGELLGEGRYCIEVMKPNSATERFRVYSTNIFKKYFVAERAACRGCVESIFRRTDSLSAGEAAVGGGRPVRCSAGCSVP